jgi:hypothetical protein
MRTRLWVVVAAAVIAAVSVGAAAKRRVVGPPPAPCLKMSDSTLFLSYNGAVTQCTAANGSACAPGENVDFAVLPRGYSFACDSHTITWNFSDGTIVTTTYPQSPVRHVFADNGTFIVTAIVRNSGQQYVLGLPVVVAVSGK